MRETGKAYLSGILRFLLLWYGVLIVGIPFIVLLSGHQLGEGWGLLVAHKTPFIVLCCLPFPFIAIWLFDEAVTSRKISGKADVKDERRGGDRSI